MYALALTNPAALGRDRGPDLALLPSEFISNYRWIEPLIDPKTLDEPWAVFERQGLAAQSLSVMYLSKAFVKWLHNEMYGPRSSPVLVFEEPETHLSPQAARTLWRHVRALPGQKIVTTHSPYFVQHVPFRDLRLVRLTENGTEAKFLASKSFVTIPPMNGLEAAVRRSNGVLQYERVSETLTVDGALCDRTYRTLLACCGPHERRRELEGTLRNLKAQSLRYIDDNELRSLETFARRIRGEIFFADCWMIVEGQADYLIMHALAHAMRYDLDSQGVSVIDAQNNGSPQAFAVLARALDISWIAVFDGDAAGNRYRKALRKRGFSDATLTERCRFHPEGDLEAQLVADGLGAELRKILDRLGVTGASSLTDKALPVQLRKKKVDYAAELANLFRANRRIAKRAPHAFRTALGMLPSMR